MNQLEKEFFKIVSGWDYDKALEFDRDNFEENQGIVSAESPTAKAAAALCERKMREAIELAREGEYVGPSVYSRWKFEYDEKGILEKVSPKDLNDQTKG